MNPQRAAIQTLIKLFRHLDRNDRLFLVGTMLVSCIPALIEVVIAGMVAVLATSFVAVERITTSPYFEKLLEWTHWEALRNQETLCMGLMLGLFAVILIKNAVALLQTYVSARFAEHISRKIAVGMLDFFVRAPWAWHLRQNIADLQFSVNVSNYNGLTLLHLSVIFCSSLTILLLFAGLALADVYIAFGLLFFGGLSGAVAILFCRRHADKVSARTCATEKEVNQLLYLAMHGVREFKLFGKTAEILDKYTNKRLDYMSLRSKVTVLNATPVALLEMISFIFLPAIMWFLLHIQHFSMERTVAIMGLLAGSAWRILPAMNGTLNSVMLVRSTMPYLTNNLQRLDEAKEILRGEIPCLTDGRLPFEREITVQQLRYCYPDGTAALEDVSFLLPKGSMTGIVGLSGSGKTTLINLLTQLLRPASGGIIVDGQALTPELEGVWRKKLGYVPQAPYIFNGTLAENIAFADFGGIIDRERVTECCRLAQLDFYDQLENGMDTVIGERGLRLSGGQIQRVAIARALYGNPEIIIFDEATSALDMKNEHAIQDTILSLRNSVTMILVAHRLSTVQECDQIIWLEKGRIHAIGEAADLLTEYSDFLERELALQSKETTK